MRRGEADQPPPQIDQYHVKRIKIESDDVNAVSVYKVTCPRHDCGKWFIVKLTWWKGQYRGRSCPYCYKVSWVPWERPK
jgi:hypothetical protein